MFFSVAVSLLKDYDLDTTSWLKLYHAVPFQTQYFASGDGILICKRASVSMICLLVVSCCLVLYYYISGPAVAELV
jgi:hypothetical protein